MAAPLRRLRRGSGRKCTYTIDVSLPTISSQSNFLRLPQLKVLKDAIEGDYVFEMLIDELPVWGALGEVVHEEGSLGMSTPGARVYLYPHLLFSIGYHSDQIVTANVTTDARSRVDITDVRNGQEVSSEH